jgi:hypothetical protein
MSSSHGWGLGATKKGAEMKRQKIYARKSEVQPQSKESLYAKLLRGAKVAVDDAATVADVLSLCLTKVCDCT